jgi:hypothetical protein
MVDMSDYTGPAYTTVNINGTFNGWCGGCNAMNDMGAGIWSVTLPLPAGPIEYKFTLDGWNAFEEFTGTETCIDPVNDGFANRYYQVTADATIPVVCFNSCEACPSDASINENDAVSVSIHPIPVVDFLTVEAEEVIEMVELFDLSGKRVKSQTLEAKTAQVNISELNEGTYVMLLHTSKGVATRKVIKM